MHCPLNVRFLNVYMHLLVWSPHPVDYNVHNNKLSDHTSSSLNPLRIFSKPLSLRLVPTLHSHLRLALPGGPLLSKFPTHISYVPVMPFMPHASPIRSFSLPPMLSFFLFFLFPPSSSSFSSLLHLFFCYFLALFPASVLFLYVRLSHVPHITCLPLLFCSVV